MKPKHALAMTHDTDLHQHFDKLSAAKDRDAQHFDKLSAAKDMDAQHPASRREQEVIQENLESAAQQGKVDMVNLPPHYARFPIEPIRFAVENGLNFLEANAIKYVCRAPHKNGLEDYDKAIRCIQMLKKRLTDDPDWWMKEGARR